MTRPQRSAAILAMAAALFLGAVASLNAQSATTPGCPGTSIRSPFASQVVSETVTILGSARIEGFRFYKLEWAPAAEPESWRGVSQTIEQSVTSGLLDRWDTRTVPDGRYRLKLTSVDERSDERCRFVVEDLMVANQGPPSSEDRPTSLPSPTSLGRARATQTRVAPGSPDESSEGESEVAPVPKLTEVVAPEGAGTGEPAAGEGEGEATETTDDSNADGTEDADAGGEADAGTGHSDASTGSDPSSSQGHVGTGPSDSDDAIDALWRSVRAILSYFVYAFLLTAGLAFLILAYRRREAAARDR